MTTLRSAAERALEALDNVGVEGNWEREEAAVVALRAALAPVPVAWIDREGDLYKMPEIEGWAPPHTLLYTHPPQRKPLTDAEIFGLYESTSFDWVQGKSSKGIEVLFARAIERAHGIGGEE
jgi:hypothetical protein